MRLGSPEDVEKGGDDLDDALSACSGTDGVVSWRLVELHLLDCLDDLVSADVRVLSIPDVPARWCLPVWVGFMPREWHSDRGVVARRLKPIGLCVVLSLASW